MATDAIDVRILSPGALLPSKEDRAELESLLPRKEDFAETDGVPMDTPWHRSAINLLIESTQYRFRDRSDYYVGGNMFIYYSARQARTWEYRGPDFFFVKGVDGTRERRFWLVWDEDGKYPDTIIELLSPSTEKEDRTTKKKTIYEQTFRTPEYFLYDPATRHLEGWRRNGLTYQPIPAGEHGRLWSEQMEQWLGTWEGVYQNMQATWLRFFDAQGQLVPWPVEAAVLQAQAAEQRAQAAETEVARLKALLARKNGPPSTDQ